MNITNWKVFLTIAKYSSINLAAEKLNISQSGTSYILKTLEKELGFPLFIRSRKGMELTSNGKLLLTPINNLMSQADNIKKLCNEICGLDKGSIHIGSFSSIAASALPEIIDCFNADYPDIKIEVIEGDSSKIENDLNSHKIDFAFTSYRKRNNFHWINLEKDYLKAVIPKSEESIVNDPVPLKYFQDNSMIASNKSYEYDVNKILSKYNIKPQKIVFTSKDENTIIALIKKELGSSLLFSKILAVQNTKGVIVRNTTPVIFRNIGIAFSDKNDLSPAANKFIEYTINNFKKYHK